MYLRGTDHGLGIGFLIDTSYLLLRLDCIQFVKSRVFINHFH